MTAVQPSTSPAPRRSPRGRPAPRVHGRLWRELIASPVPASAGELAAAIGTSIQTADHRLKLWVGAGLLDLLPGRPQRYRLNPATETSSMPPVISADGHARARQQPAYQRLWSAMRVLGRFDLVALRMVAQSSERTTLGYIGLLQRTGYVQLEKLGNPRTGECSRYRLARNSGPKAPRETILATPAGKRRVFTDPNTGVEHDISRGAASQRRSYRRDTPADGGEG